MAQKLCSPWTCIITLSYQSVLVPSARDCSWSDDHCPTYSKLVAENPLKLLRL